MVSSFLFSKRRIVYAGAVFISLIAFSRSLEAQELRIALGNYHQAPYNFDSSGKAARGLIADLCGYIAHEIGYDIKWVGGDAQSVRNAFARGEIDVLPFASTAWDDKEQIFSLPLFDERNIVVVNSRGGIRTTKLEDLNGLRIGTIKGFVYPNLDRRFKLGFAERKDFSGLSDAVRALDEGKIDAVVGSDLQIEYMMRNLALRARLIVCGYVESVNPLRWEISPHADVDVAEINAAIDRLNRKGIIRSVLDSYRGSHAR